MRYIITKLEIVTNYSNRSRSWQCCNALLSCIVYHCRTRTKRIYGYYYNTI